MVDLSDTHVFLGKVKGSGAPVWYPMTELTKHALLLGATGSGKTNLLYLLGWQLQQNGGVGIWIFDRKQDMRHMLHFCPNGLLVFDLTENFCCNPLEPPPHVKAKKWVDNFSDLFCRCNNLLDGSRGMLHKTVSDLFERHGVYDGSSNYPSFFELLESLQKKKLPAWGRAPGYRESLVNRLESYLATNKQLYDCSRGYRLESLLDKTVVFELTGMLDVQSNFWVNHLLLWTFSYRLLGIKERGNRLLNLIVFDEAKSVFPAYENREIGVSPISLMISMLREFGCGIVASDQSAQLSNSLFANTQLKVLFGLGSGDDLSKAARAMGLSPEQVAYAHSLGVGEAIVHYQRIGKTFVLQIPRFPLE